MSLFGNVGQMTSQEVNAMKTGLKGLFGKKQASVDKETAFAIHKVLHTLNEPYKEVFSLRTFGELSFKQIAELFGKTETWARVTYHRARLRIMEELK